MTSLIEKYEFFIFDCDGVIWRGLEPLPGANELINKLESLNKGVIYVTNNSTKTKQCLADTISNVVGVTVKNPMSLYSSGTALADALKKKMKPGEKVYLIGSKGVADIMDDSEIDYIGFGSDMNPCLHTEFKDFKPDPDVKYVVAGFDPYFNYTKMSKAFIYINECKAEYLVSNLDVRYPLSKDRTLPGTGSLLNGLNHALGFAPIVMGKPSSSLYDLICSDHKITDNSKVLMIGDNLLTDIQFGINSGIDTCLVLSGITTRDMVLEDGAPQPSYIVDSVADIA